MAVVPASVRTGSPRRDLTTVPLSGVEPSHVVLATRTGDHSRLVAAFRKSAQAHLTGETGSAVRRLITTAINRRRFYRRAP